MIAFLADCGIGSDPDATGPCTGGYGPTYLSDTFTAQLVGAKAELFAVGAALLVLVAMLVLIRLVKRSAKAAGLARREMSDAEFTAKIDALRPGEAWCMDCDVVYAADGFGCPCCGGGADVDHADSFGVEESEPFDGVCRECGAVGDPSDDWYQVCGAGIDGAMLPESSDSQPSMVQDHDAQTGPGYTTCGSCGFADDPENIEENGGICNACRSDMEENHWRDGAGIGSREGFR